MRSLMCSSDSYHVNHCSTHSTSYNNINEDLENEEIVSFELGYGYTTDDLTLNVSNVTILIGVTDSSQEVYP